MSDILEAAKLMDAINQELADQLEKAKTQVDALTHQLAFDALFMANKIAGLEKERDQLRAELHETQGAVMSLQLRCKEWREVAERYIAVGLGATEILSSLRSTLSDEGYFKNKNGRILACINEAVSRVTDQRSAYERLAENKTTKGN